MKHALLNLFLAPLHEVMMKNESNPPITEQQKNYDLLLKQSEKLVAMLKESADEAALDAAITDRQETIEKVMKTDQKMKKAKGKSSPELIAKLGKTLEKIIALDGESRKLIETTRSNLVKKITDMSKKVSAIKGYGPQTGSGPGKFISVRK